MSAFTSLAYSVGANSHLQNGASDRKNQKCWLIEEKWIWHYNGLLQDFVQTFGNRVNQSLGKALAGVKKKNVLHFIAATKQKQYSKTTRTTEPRYNVGDKLRVSSQKCLLEKSTDN